MSDTRLAQLSIILVNYNGRHHLERCLPALYATEARECEIVVVDNASQDDSLEWMASHYPAVRALPMDSNLGFGEANRRGIEATTGEFFSLLNNDTEPQPGWLEHMLSAFDSAPEVGVACATLELMDRPGILNARGGSMTWLGLGHDIMFGRSTRSRDDAAPQPAYRDVLFPTAAAMVMRRSSFEQVGGFDPQYFMYHEDVDLGWRVWLQGERVVTCRDSIVHHRFGGTTATHGGHTWSSRMGFRHNIRALLKNYEWPRALAATLVFTATLLARFQIRLVWHIWSWNLRRLPDTLRERRRIQGKRVRRDREFFESGLIDRSRLYPLPKPELPVRGEAWGRKNWIKSPVLTPESDSAKGRLAVGWYAIHRRGKEIARTVSGPAQCFLKVEPNTSGVLHVQCRYWAEGGEESTTLRVECNGHTAEARVAGGTITCDVETVSDDDGVLSIWLLPEPGEARPGFLGLAPPGNISFPELRFESEAAPQEDRYRSIAVVIPTYNRWDCLEVTLDALCEQERLPDEVIVVDDGSTDGTSDKLEAWENGKDLPFSFKRFRQENAGPAKARNFGVQQAQSDIVAFLGDDTIPAPDWVKQHIDQQNSLDEGCAVVGYTGWDADHMRVTPFLRYINGRGAQFGYDLMRDGAVCPFTCFYTSNLSLPRSYLQAEPFDEQFRYAGWEDAEVGYRLGFRGMRVVYRRAAVTRHRHQTTVATFMRRQFLVGRICPTLLSIHSELGALYHYKDSPMSRAFIALGYLGQPVLPVVRLLDYLHVPLPRALYLAYLGWYYVRGLRAGEKEVAA